MEDFLFPASKIVVQTRKNGAETPLDPIRPICYTPPTTNAAFDLLVALCNNCVPNLKMVAETLTDMYYSGRSTQTLRFLQKTGSLTIIVVSYKAPKSITQ